MTDVSAPRTNNELRTLSRALYDEIENPKARGMFETWLEKNSKARHAMFAALVGVLIAIILGILTLIVAVVQTYIAWQAWKSPVPDGLSMAYES